MNKTKNNSFGKLEPKHNFMFSPYPDLSLWRCPFCDEKTGQKKLPLVILVNPNNVISLNFTSKYCSKHDLLIADKIRLEDLLYKLFSEVNPEIIGNEYFVLGTMEKKAWKARLDSPCEVNNKDLPANTHNFINYYKELRMTQKGWYRKDVTPPVKKPAQSTVWIKK